MATMKKIKWFAKENMILEKDNNPNTPKKSQEAKHRHYIVQARSQHSLEQINTYTYRKT